MAAKHLFLANEIGLFAKLAPGPATLDQLAGLTGIATDENDSDEILPDHNVFTSCLLQD